MTSAEIRKKYIEFFEGKGHKHIPSAPLIPEHDPTVLFTTAGMHPLVPYLMGEVHPEGRRLVNFQKCIRTDDIDEVGDETHLTFFEMLGNWSLGDYFKKEAIEWSFEFLTSKKWLHVPLTHIAVSVFSGDSDAPRDEESAQIWNARGIPAERIAYLPKEDNWWGPAGKTGPCGPDTEMFFWNSKEEPPHTFDQKDPRWVEIWNDVFMQYNKTADGRYEPLVQKNVDTGMGLERMSAVMQHKKSIYETDLFAPLIQKIESYIPQKELYNKRLVSIIADHIKASTFILGDEYSVTPTNVGQGYILRRLIRRTVRFAHVMGISENFLSDIAHSVIELFHNIYPELDENKEHIFHHFKEEEQKFNKTLEKGLHEFEKIFYIYLYDSLVEKMAQLYPTGNMPFQIENSGDLRIMMLLKDVLISPRKAASLKEEDKTGLAREKKRRESFIQAVLSHSPLIKEEFIDKFSRYGFTLYDTYGFPFEFTKELAGEKGVPVDTEIFKQAFSAHQEKSRKGADKKFAGGLADHSEETKKLHTATHLLHQTLRQVLGSHVKQKGSNITHERLRFDFPHPKPLSPDEIQHVEDVVNQKIHEAIPVTYEELNLDEARKKGAIGLFPTKYDARVKVYSIGDFSKEICGGPHVENTKDLGSFKIIKEESCGAGIRRIKATL